MFTTFLYFAIRGVVSGTACDAPLDREAPTAVYENVDSRKSVELASSRDLAAVGTGREPYSPFIELSPVGDGSAYDTGQISVVNGPIRRNNELWFYYLGVRHRSQPLADIMNRKLPQ